MKAETNSYSGFTLIEMLVVLSIFIILFGIGLSAFSGLRTSILMNQTTETLKQNVRWTQRASILLKRDPGENWIYGVGLDLSQFYGENGTYRVFKWCAPFREYSDDERGQGSFPNHIDGTIGQLDQGDTGNLPFDNSYIPIGGSTPTLGPKYGVDCMPNNIDPGVDPDGILAEVGNKGVGLIDDFTIPAPLIPGYETFVGNDGPRFIVFESVSGNAFFYDQNGYLMNYDDSSGDGEYYLEPDPIDFDFVIGAPGLERGINLVMSGRSGKLVNSGAMNDPTSDYTFETLFVDPPSD